MSLKFRYFHSLVLLLPLLLASGCIKNDLPYPRIQQDILSIAANGQSQGASIDKQNLQVKIYLDETTNPADVTFSEFTYTEGAECSVNLLEGSYDLTSPLRVSLSLYQTYDWLITAEQTIERRVQIAGQIGATVIDEVGRRVIVQVPETADLSDLELTEIKLGPEGLTTMSPDLKPGKVDFQRPVKVDVTYFGKTYDWTIYVERTKLIVSTTAADAWAQVIWVYGAGPDDGSVNGVQYRRADSAEWIDVPADWVTHDGGSFMARIIHLTPLTDYVVRTVSGDNVGNEISVTTEATMILPDGSFDQWWLNGKVWCPWDEFGEQYWDTGNTGAATLGQSNVTPTDYTPTGSGQAVKLETRFVGIGSIGKLAAGSIFTGKFKKVDGTNGILDFGRPWSCHPTRLRGYYRYNPEPINYASSEFKSLIGKPDTCHIYVLLTDWTEPFEVRTNPKNQNLLDFSSPSVIAYGGLLTATPMDDYQEFDIQLQYRSTARKPTYIVVVAAASKYGDYFTGGTGTVLYVDQFSLEYDY